MPLPTSRGAWARPDGRGGRLMHLRARDLAFVVAGFGVLVMAPVARYRLDPRPPVDLVMAPPDETPPPRDALASSPSVEKAPPASAWGEAVAAAGSGLRKAAEVVHLPRPIAKLARFLGGAWSAAS